MTRNPGETRVSITKMIIELSLKRHVPTGVII